VFWLRLGDGDPSRIPSALIGHPAPQTALPPLIGLVNDGVQVPGLDPAMFKGKGQQWSRLGSCACHVTTRHRF